MLRFVWGTFRCHSNVNARVSGVGTHLASLASATFSAYEFMPVVFPTKYEIVDSFMPHDAKGAAGTAAFPNGLHHHIRLLSIFIKGSNTAIQSA